ncbi:MAG: DNA-binding protein WhiA [Clostridia bacterium]|nr:DNA-binding protein WhiA [Clostridia bacterium]MBQ9507145.1 DNA-binding protein WhiA [Clostridia bacterium]
MSYASQVKSELLQIENEACCEVSLARGLLLFGRECSPASISILTENGEIAAAYARAARLFCGHTPDIHVSESGNFKVVIDNRGETDAILGEVLMRGLNQKKQLTIGTIDRECCRAAFIRGAFLASGTVTDPDREYHLEFSCPSGNLAQELQALIRTFEIEMKLTRRGGANILYLKKSGDIEDLLMHMGASESSMMLMGSKMYKDVRNTVNRRVNFENANIARSIAAAGKQLDAIERIEKHGGLAQLTPELRELAELRIENPDLSTGEIGKLLSEPLTLSGVNHRFKKLIRIAEDIE